MSAMLTAREVADQLGFCTDTILRWVDRGDFPAYRLGRALRFHQDDVDAWIEERATPRRGVLATPRDAARRLGYPVLATPKDEED